MKQPVRIGLVFNHNQAYTRGVLRGIKHFAQTRPDWILVSLDTDALTLPALRAMQPDGLIAHVFSGALAATLRALRRPLVNVSTVVPGLTFPRVAVDHEQIGQLAAAHLQE